MLIQCLGLLALMNALNTSIPVGHGTLPLYGPYLAFILIREEPPT